MKLLFEFSREGERRRREGGGKGIEGGDEEKNALFLKGSLRRVSRKKTLAA